MSRAIEISNEETCTSRLHINTARQIIYQDCQCAVPHEITGLRKSLNRITAEALTSPINVPPYTNSAVDGYAVGYDYLIPEGNFYKAKIAGTAWAGNPYQGTVEPGTAIRIMTGAVMPAATDTVVMQENTAVHGPYIYFDTRACKVGENVRAAGEDLAEGSTALAKGKRLTAADLGLLASIGIDKFNCYRKLRVGFFSTGNELRSVGQPLNKGEIYDSNRYTLFGMLQDLHMDIVDLGVIKDDRAALADALSTITEQCDAVITTGGVSVGDADYMRQVIGNNGDIYFWQVAIKPGRPLVYGRINNTPFFGLPGNPVAVMVTFYQFVQQALMLLAGSEEIPSSPTFKARSGNSFRKKPGRTEFQRAIMQTQSNGETWVHSTGKQGSGILRSMSEANCFVVLPHDSHGAKEGDWVDVQPFNGMIR
ncbi:MAG: molybdopterin molybdotransferase MoeA [Gammaproteobacteria bacterium]|jgi:molybdopterin molybdotransferase